MSGRSIRYCRMLLDLGFCRDISQCPFRHRLSPCAALAAAGAGRSFHAVMHCSKVSTGSSAAHNAKNPCSSAQPLPARSSRLSCSVSSTASQADHPAQPPDSTTQAIDAQKSACMENGFPHSCSYLPHQHGPAAANGLQAGHEPPCECMVGNGNGLIMASPQQRK